MIDKVAWMPVKDRKVLFARTAGQVLFYCVGGKRKQGETDEETLVRETLEEAGVELDLATVRHLHTFEGPSHPSGMMTMACYDAVALGTLEASSEVEELAWFTTADMHRTTDMGRDIIEWFHQQGLID